MLTVSHGQTLLSRGSTKFAYFDCDCGAKRVLKQWNKVFKGRIKTCGRCNVLSVDHFQTTKYGKLQMKFPKEYHKGSNKKTEWICDCGNESILQIISVTSGGTSTCGRCNVLPSSYWKKKKFGSLKLKEPISIHKSSGKKLEWICDCGKHSTASVIDVTRGHTKSCGNCKSYNKSFWKNKKFRNLKMEHPDNIHFRSNKKVSWICDCGNRIDAIIQNVTQGRTTSCGDCRSNIDGWYESNKEKILELKPPINQKNIPGQTFLPLEDIISTRDPFKTCCSVCGSVYEPRWEKVRIGVSLTCGCCTNRVSSSQYEISKFIHSLGYKNNTEYKVGKLKYDIFVPHCNTLIEYNGLRWHSFPESKDRDMKKYLNAIDNGFNYIMIFEDEWVSKRSSVESFLKNKLGAINQVSVRPNKCKIEVIGSKKANKFFEEFHYIGKAKTKVNYGVSLNGLLVACCSFGSPTRQSKHQWELVRMASNPNFRIHGIWSKIFGIFLKNYLPKSVVSFSDKRLFSGNVYWKMGFSLDGKTPPSYYWVKGQKRFHKSGLRKTPDEKKSGLTESQLRETQGYRKIWDLGKDRWVYND